MLSHGRVGEAASISGGVGVDDKNATRGYPTWWFCPLGGEEMQRVNLHDFYSFGHILHRVIELNPGSPLKEYYFPLAWARINLGKFVNDQLIPMTICKPAAWKIIHAVTELFPNTPEEREKVDMGRVLDALDLYTTIEAVKEFETVFAAEVQNMATYFVSKKAIYDTNDLIARADELFTDNVRQHISEQSKHDVREAGKCLAFDLATAAGFHIARAVEGALVDYLKLLCQEVMTGLKESQRNLGNYIKLARENDGDEKVCGSLDQFRDLHRNPLIHPESVLTIEEAITLLGIAQSAIVAIVLDTVKRKNQSLPLPIS